MSAPAPELNLLFAVLALQNELVGKDQLLAAMNAWGLEKHRPLADILVEKGSLQSDHRKLLEGLIDWQLNRHGSAEKSLAAVPVSPWLQEQIQSLCPADMQASLANLNAANADRYATVSSVPVSAGVRFRILRPHAKGGLGEVFVAEDTELHREVALKEIQTQHADNNASRGRFVLEAEITGGLEHPGIVPVYGLGTYADGRPFYAMRFIRGDSLKEAIERFHLGRDRQGVGGAKPLSDGRGSSFTSLEFRQLLGRFIDVCNAIAYAHSRGVLHRDLKPGNIMLGKYGETLVVDWGLAKASGKSSESPSPDSGFEEPTLRPSSGSGVAETFAGTTIGTPAFMSPEQAAGRLDLLGPPSDVYSLGATLYCLLTGRVPMEDKEVADVLRKVQQGDFPRPRQIKSDVPAPLEAICLKAMARAPGERYDSPRALADDIEHWLADEPVIAWPEPRAVKAGRWMRRHKPLVSGAAAALLVGLVALTAGVFWRQSQQAEAARKQVRAEEKVRQGLDQARHTRADLHKMLEQPGGVQDLLNQPARWQAQIASARADAQRAKDHAEGTSDPQWTNLLKTLEDDLARDQADFNLALRLEKIRLDKATLVEGEFDYAQAERAYSDAFAQAGFAIAPGRQQEVALLIQQSSIKDQLLAALDDWALVTHRGKNPDFSSRLLEVARRADPDPWRDKVRDPSFWKNGQGLEKLAEEVRADRKFLAQLSPQMLFLVYRGLPAGKTQESWIRTAQTLHPADFWINFWLAALLSEKGKAADAVGFYRVALAIRPNNAIVYNNLGFSLVRTKDLAAAIDAYHKALALDPHFASAWKNLGSALYDKKDLPAAIDAYHKALAIDPKYVGAWYGLAFALRDSKDLPAAIEAHNKALALDANIAAAWFDLGGAFRDPKRLPGAIDALMKAAFGSEMSQARTWYNLGNSLRNKNNLPAAIDAYKKAIFLDPKYVAAWNNLGITLCDKNDFPAAIDAYNHALAIDPHYAIARNNLGNAQKLLALAKRLPGVLQGDAASAADLLDLANLCQRYQKRYGNAAELYAKAFAADPKAAGDLDKRDRYNAACAAALAAAGKGADVDKLQAKEQARLRKQALDWLQADLAEWAKLLAKDSLKTYNEMLHWQRDGDLFSLRDEKELAKIPAVERAASQKLWGEVSRLAKQAKKN